MQCTNRKKYIIIDGPDGCGKTTLINQLKQNYPDFIYVKEPGDERFELTRKIRELFLYNEEDISDASRLHLMISDRIKLQEYINTQIALGKTVISDRSFCSTIAYQTNLKDNVMIEDILDAHSLYFRKFNVDAIVLLDIQPETRIKRMINRNQQLDSMEQKNDKFFETVIARYGNLKKVLAHINYSNLADKINYLDANKCAHSVYEDFVAKFL